MPDPSELFALGSGAVVAPAGHGKTEIIAKVAALSSRPLILTHTHAGVHAIRARLKRLGIHSTRAAVDTIAGWCMRYAHAFPTVAHPPKGMPQSGTEWDQLYRGATLALAVKAIREVVAASYDRVLIDEYQDCHALQHQLAIKLSGIIPTLIFGDPMQGIFEFAGATLPWREEIHQVFPFAGTLETPHRWAGPNPELGQWVAETRMKLLEGESIDLSDPRITYRKSEDAFDMGVLFEGMEDKEGSFAAIHCNKAICYRLARAANGGYQAIEEIAANRLREFAATWDRASQADDRLRAITSLIDDCFLKKQRKEGDEVDAEDTNLQAALRAQVPELATGDGIQAALKIFALSRKRSRWKLFRNELWRDAERAMGEVSSGRAESVSAATTKVRQRVSNSGRKLPKRTVSTPLLLKGLEFDHVVIPDATHFGRERQAQAKLFYVALSRATRSLTISASTPILRFDRPTI